MQRRAGDKYHSNSASTDPRDRGKTWTHSETEAMIRLWASDDIQQQLRSTLRNNHVFRVISKRLSATGYARTSDQCRTKVKSLKSTYRRLKDLNNAKKARRLFSFYDLFERALNKPRPTATAPAHDVAAAEIKTETVGLPQDSDEVTDGTATGWPQFDNSNGLPAAAVDDCEGEDDNEEDEEEEDEEDDVDDDDDDAEGVGDNDSLLDTLPLTVQLGHSSDDDGRDIGDDVNGELLMPPPPPLRLNDGKGVRDDADDDRRRMLNDSPLGQRRDATSLSSHHQPQPSKQRRRTGQPSRAAAAQQNHHLRHQEQLAERLVQHFLRAEETMLTRMEQMEERRMKFESDLAQRQQREDTERFRQLFQLLSNPPPGASHVVATAQPTVQPPRVVYMQEVGPPPNWTN